MSYCRWSEGDVYAYDSVEGGVRFCVAHGRRDLDRLCKTYNEAYQYARVLRDTHGLDVPDFAIEALKADAIEEAVRICGPNSAVSELEAENAQLRQQLADATESMGRVEERCAKLREQNDKLRLLATAMQVYGSMDTDVDLLRALEIRDAIKRLSDELGVEVTS